MSANLLDSINIATADHCDYSVIWLHGLGASGHDFEPIVPELALPQSPGVKFIFPHAPVRPITINGGSAMRGWYDITSLDFGSREQDIIGVQESTEHVMALIQNQIDEGVPASNILLAGFSQGGAIALYAGLTCTHKLGGIMALSTYLPIQDIALAELTEHSKSLPVFMAHGRHDEVIQIQHAQQSRDILKDNGVAVQWHDYAMAHSVSSDEIADMSVWFKAQFGI